ncbi:MAG: IS110 family transposase [Dehalococcoidia bacterium]|nr:IS110 family transposase [Dehalococcoidia bacterium]
MIHSVGIDLHQGRHRARCLDDRAQPCDSFSFQTTPEGLATLEERVFRDGANPIIVLEPAGLPWLMVAVYLRSRHPDCRLVKAKTQKVAALRRYLRGPVKTDRLDALTLAKMPFIDPEQMDEIYLPPAEIHALQRLTRQRKRLEGDITGRKVRISAIVDGYLPGVRRAFNDVWSSPVRAFLRSRLNHFAVVRDGEEALHAFLSKASPRSKWSRAETRLVFLACQSVASVCELSRPAGTVNEEFFLDLQDEIARELRLMEAEEAESESLARRIAELYQKLHPSDNLCTIPGVGKHTAPVFLAAVGDPARFPNQSSFANWEGVVPGARQSSNVEAKGLRMTKAGPSIMRMALYQAGDVGRRWDPQLAAVYYREMVYHGKNHRQAMGAVMSHLGARVLTVLKQDRPYELKDIEGNPISKEHARKLILAEYHVPEDIRRERRRRNSKISKDRETATYRINEAAKAPQPVPVQAVSRK